MLKSTLSRLGLMGLSLAAGCNSSVPESPRSQALAALSPDDRALAQAQGYCAVTSEPLGDMGTPLKLTLNDQPVWICCAGCERKAKSQPEKTLAHAAALKAQVASESPSTGKM